MADLMERLEPRRLCAASPAVVTIETTPDGLIVITGTRRPETIGVVEHFPGLALFDVFVDGTYVRQLGGAALRIDGRGGDDVLQASAGVAPVTLIGGSGNDTLRGGAGPAQLEGGNGNDSLTGVGGNDVLRGGKGRDTLTGGAGNDYLDAGPGYDTLDAGDGTDILLAGSGRDTLDGGAGDDTLSGGRGRDLITGGPGSDLFSLVDREREAVDFTEGEDHRSAADV